MSASFGINKLQLRAYGEATTVPNNNIAKLMYYLDCVSTVIEYDKYNILTDYQHYYELTFEQKKAVYELALLLHPKIFIDAGIFIVDPALLIDDLSNKFYKITDETIGVHANQQIVVGGKTVRVLNVMACDSSWLNRNYYIPLQAITNEIERRTNPGKQFPPYVETDTSMNLNTAIIVNQSVEFRTNPVSIVCIHCKNPVMTNTKSKLNFTACFCFLIFGLLYILCQACMDKNICCCDVIHYCPKCGREVGRYDSC